MSYLFPAVLKLTQLGDSGFFIGYLLDDSRQLPVVEESVAGRGEALPQIVAVFLGDCTDALPFLLHGNEFLGSIAPVGAVFQSLGLSHKLLFVSEVCCKFFTCTALENSLGGEEIIATLTEAGEKRTVHLLGSESEFAPLLLQVLNHAGHLFP